MELDPISGGIAKQLYQDATVHVSGYEETTFPDNFFDLVISNVPFANYKPYDPKHNKRRFSLHDYYFVKSLAHTRPGGIVAFITSSFTMDKVRARARKAIADQADFLGAIRLPNNAFKKNAGTEVTTDIIFLRKKGAGRAMDAEPWIETVEAMSGTDKITINEYYKRHPEMMLGTMSLEGTQYRAGEQALVSDGRDLGQALGEAVEKLPEGVVGVEQHEATRPYVEAATIPAPGDVKDEGFVFHGDNLMRKVGDELVPAQLPTGKDGKPTAASRRKVRIIKDILPIRDAARRVLKLQREDATDRAIEKAMKRLNQRYDTFVEKHGYLSAKENKTAFAVDPDSSLILALENWNADTKTAAKADIFTKKTIARVTPVESVESVKDGLMVSLNEGGRIDWKHIARISGVSAKQAQQELLEEGVVYENPEGGWETADAYLSGNVRAKLAAAKAAAAVDSKYKRNAAALEAVQPEDLPPHKIATRLGSPWTPPEYLSQFIGSLLNIEPDAVKVEYLEGVGRWVITSGTRYTPLNDFRNRTEAMETWGTPDRDFFNLLDAALNLRKVAVTRKDSGGKESTDVKATDAAQEKLSKIKEEFERWIYADTGRAETIAQIYNTDYNNIK
ncbi:MAG: N-6 DNA methylase, partial [Myxococcota bacterium]